MVPAGPEDPLAGFRDKHIGADALLHVGERGYVVEVDGELLLAGGGHVGVGIVEAGHDEGTVKVDDLGVRAAQFEDVGVGADGDEGGVGDGEGLDAGGREGRVVRAEVRAGENGAVEVESVGGGVWRGVLGGGGRGGHQAGYEEFGAHGLSVMERTGWSYSSELSSRELTSEGLGKVEDGEQDAAEGEFAAGGVVPLGEGVDAGTGASGGKRGGGDAEGEREIGVSGAEAEVGADAEVAVDGTESVKEWGVDGEFGGRAVADGFGLNGYVLGCKGVEGLFDEGDVGFELGGGGGAEVERDLG